MRASDHEIITGLGLLLFAVAVLWFAGCSPSLYDAAGELTDPPLECCVVCNPTYGYPCGDKCIPHAHVCDAGGKEINPCACAIPEFIGQ